MTFQFTPGTTVTAQSYDDTGEAYDDTGEAYDDTGESIWRRRSSYYAGAQPVRSGLITTNRGSAQFQLREPYVKYSDFRAAMDNAYRANIRNQQLVTRVNSSLQQLQSSSMIMPLFSFLQAPPKLDSITFPASQAITPGAKLNVQDSTMKPIDNTMMMMAMMMPMMTSSGSGGGGTSGFGGQSTDMFMWMFLFLIMSGGFGGTRTTP